jgi:hypothetical protein
MPAPDAPQTAEALVLIQAQAQARQDLVDLTQAQVAAQVRTFAAWYDEAQIAAWASRLAKLVRASQKQTAATTDVYALRILTLMTGKRPTSAGPVKVDDLWGGVPLETVFARLPAQVRWLESTRGPDALPEARISPESGRVLSPLTPDEIVERVVTRAEVQAETALSLAFREQWVSDLAESGPTVGYRRVLHPELSKGGSCGLCIVAATAVYKKSQLMPLHGRCACSVAPVVGESLGPGDPGAAINDEDLAAIYDAAGSTRGRALKETRFRVVDHPELGPLLTFAGHSHRGPKDVAESLRD